MQSSVDQHKSNGNEMEKDEESPPEDKVHIRRLLQYNNHYSNDLNNYSSRDTQLMLEVGNNNQQIEIEMVEFYNEHENDNPEDNPWNCNSGYLALPLDMYNKYF